MKSYTDYNELREKFLCSINESNKFKYTAIMRLAFSNFKVLMGIFPLTEIVSYLEKDTGIKINYASIWSAYNSIEKKSHKSDQNHFKDGKSEIKTVVKTEQEAIADKEIKQELEPVNTEGYEWLYTGKFAFLGKNDFLVNHIIECKITEAEMEEIKPSMFLTTALKQIRDYYYAREDRERSRRVFGN